MLEKSAHWPMIGMKEFAHPWSYFETDQVRTLDVSEVVERALIKTLPGSTS